jgi:hypothetical protein
MASASSPEGCPFEYKIAPPRGSELSKALARESQYPDEDTTNLQRVALHYQFRKGGSREALVNAIRREIDKPEIRPSPALHMLAALPFPIIITTNYDHLFDIALNRSNTLAGVAKQPIVRVYDPTRNGPPEEVPYRPSEERPILLKLHGDLNNPGSIVVTEEDYIVFIQRMSNSHFHPIHRYIQGAMCALPTLFIGYSLKDINLRLLFRTLRWNVDTASIPLSYAVDPHPDRLIVSVWQDGANPMVSFIDEDLWDFVPALYEKCTGRTFQS